jgi:hypothetical protein
MVGCAVDKSSLQSVIANPRQAESQAVATTLKERGAELDIKVSIQKIEYVGQISEVWDGKQRTVDLWHIRFTADDTDVSALAAAFTKNGKTEVVLLGQVK